MRYTRVGTPTECMQRGFGAGAAKERLQRLPSTSLQRIKYVGPKMEARFHEAGIRTTTALVNQMRTKTAAQIQSTLRRILQREGGGLDGRAYNSTLLYLYSNGVPHLPQCTSIRFR